MTLFDELRGSRQPGFIGRPTPWNGSAFLYGLTCLRRPELAIEIGCGDGSSSVWIARALQELAHGRLICYESDPEGARAAQDKLAALWPGGDWRVILGDFFETQTGELVDFAFIDLEPKIAYLRAWRAIEFSAGAIVAAHDSSLPPFAEEILPLECAMFDSGWSVLNFPWERGFLVGMKP